jgi:hypothetical protein
MPRRSVVGLTAAAFLALNLQGSARPLPAAGFIAAFDWQSDQPKFGGFSGMWVAPDGSRLIAVSDRGHGIEARIERDAAGIIRNVDAGPVVALADEGGGPMAKQRRDAEGLTVGEDGRIYISFERFSRVMAYETLTAAPEALPLAEGFGQLQWNSSLEALASGPDGALYTLPERSGSETKPFPIFRYANGAWSQPFTLPRDPPFLPVSADFGPDGQFYLLERAFYGLSGFASRVRRFSFGPEGFGPPETLLQTAVGVHDNLEALAVWRDPSGAIRLTMLADDNFMPFQRSEIVEYSFAD